MSSCSNGDLSTSLRRKARFVDFNFPQRVDVTRSNIGLPFYGRSFAGRGLTKFGQANDGTADIITWRDDEGSPQCKCAERLRSQTTYAE